MEAYDGLIERGIPMADSLYDLQVDYVRHHGHFMVLSSPRGLKPEELSSFQMTMLSTNPVPKLLQVQLEAREGEIQLYYTITGKRILRHWLRLEKLSLYQFYSMLYQIASGLDDSRVYMLQPERYVLKDEFIYYGDSLDDLYFTYVPVEQLEGKATISEDLQHLASRWIHRVTELHGSGYQELMSYLTAEHFNLPELTQLLLKQMRLAAEVWKEQDEVPIRGARLERNAKVDSEVQFVEQHISPGETLFPLSAEGDGKALPEVKPNQLKRKSILMGATAILACCFVWKLYADTPGTRMLYICSAVTMLLVCAVFFLLRKQREQVFEENNSHMVVAEPYENMKINEADADDFLREIGLGQSNSSREVRSNSKTSMQTTPLLSSNATVLLGRLAQAGSPTNPYFEYSREGVRQTVIIHKSPFVIGRTELGVDWVWEEEGVSRLHAEIVKEGDSISIKDLGSRNGTFLNGELLVPYRVHPLKEGDIIKLITTDFVYKMR
ncbi:DUF6382 domain-containing protein [Paenibacillus cremeus]|uniref:FHA domain-containing protein n=1 Tax=Paenibacillus cremeus TaxID=2163881 RepID=A0A559KDC1_9BACL|nr:DUF6382 domain-containing protein [Paenibacillus cremeus]TVY10115.1 FHA domain-containing protein [Paenibacillus cremeus]